MTIDHAYSASAAAWGRGPEKIYARLATALVAWSPVSLAGRLVLDVGAGTGVAGRAVRSAGGRVVAVDLAAGMVRAGGVPGVVGDAGRLPVRSGSVGAVVAAFCVNHLESPAAGLREAARVTRRGGAVLASSYGTEAGHPVRDAVDAALAEAGYTEPRWYRQMKAGPVAALSTGPGMAAAASEAGLDVEVAEIEVAFPELGAADLVAWRLGLAHTAPFVAALPGPARQALTARALELTGDPPVLRRRMVMLRAPGGP